MKRRDLFKLGIFGALAATTGTGFLKIYKHHTGISDHQQSWGYEDGPWKGPGPPLLATADFLIFF